MQEQPGRRVRVHQVASAGVALIFVTGLLVPFTVGQRGPRAAPAVEQLPPTVDASSAVAADEDPGNVAPPSPQADGGTHPATAAPIISEPEQADGSSVGAPVLGASDQGVTAETITVGILIADLAGLERAGLSVAAGDMTDQWVRFIERLNARGGIHGRRVEPVFRNFDPLQSDTFRASCLYLVRDRQVFAVLTTVGYYGEATLCFTEEHGVPFLSADGQPEPYHARSGQLMFTTVQNKGRMLRNYVAFVDTVGGLDGHVLGLLSMDNHDAGPVRDVLLPHLRARGYEVAVHRVLSEDAASAQPQIPVAVQAMRTAGVDVVLSAIPFTHMTSFVQTAASQAYTPAYYLSDFAQGATDYYAERMPPSFDGALAVTTTRVGEWRVGLPQQPLFQECLDHYTAASGRNPGPGTTEEISIGATCGMVQLFETGASRAGPTLTRPGFGRGLVGAGAFELPLFAGASFAPGKFDAADFERIVRWHADCACWKPLPGSSFARSPY